MAELRALERYTLEVLELQLNEKSLASNLTAFQVIDDTVEVLRGHVAKLDLQIATFVGAEEAVRTATRSMAGAFLRFLGKYRSHEISKILREDYTLLKLTSVGYLMLHTSAVALRNGKAAEMAIRHHRELAPMVKEIGELLPQLVLQELSSHFGGLDRRAAETTLLATSSNALVPTTWAATA